MEILQLTATQFIKPMSTGRTRPLLLGYENDVGETFEVVYKQVFPFDRLQTRLLSGKLRVPAASGSMEARA